MPRWKSTEQIIKSNKSGEIFDENWMNYDHVWQYRPEPIPWKEDRAITFEDVDVWEVISERGGLYPLAVYAAWTPYAHYFIVVNNWSIIGEYYGVDGEKELRKYMKENKLPYSKNIAWVEENEIKPFDKEGIGKLILP